MLSSFENINSFLDVIGGMFLLILVYLLVAHASEVSSLAATLANDSLKGIAVLQGRSTKQAGV